MNHIANLRLGLTGRFRGVAHKVDSEGNIISSREAFPWSDNLVLDRGLDLLGAPGSGIWMGLVVGTGTNAPLATDTTLQNGIAFTNTISPGGAEATVMQTGVTPYYCQKTITLRFGTGVAAGTLSEIGMVGNQPGTVDPSTALLYSRSLIVDGSGNPTTITILNDEILDVTYQSRMYVTATATGTFQQTIDGVLTTFNYTITPAFMFAASASWQGFFNSNAPMAAYSSGNYGGTGGAATGALGSITSTPSGSNDFWSSVSGVAYTNGNYYVDGTFVMDIDHANFSIAALAFSFRHCGFQMSLSPAVAKVNTKKYSFSARVSWGRYP